METPALWEKLLIGVLVVLVLLWLRPGIKASFRERRNATREDWMGVLIPLALVVLFVFMLIALT